MDDENIIYLSQWKNISANELLHPILMDVSRCIMDITLFLSIIFYSFTIFVIIKKSTPAMNTFKYEILIQITCNMCIEIIICIVNPIFLLPLPVMSFHSHFSLKKEIIIYVVCGAFLPAAFFLTTFVIALASRVVVIFDATKHVIIGLIVLKKYFTYFIIGFIMITIGAWMAISVPLCFLFGDSNLMKDRLQEIVPAFKEIFIVLPVTYGAILDTKIGFLGYIVATLAVIFICGIAAVVILLNALFLIRMKQIKKIVSKETFNLQKMLYKNLCIQLLNAGIFGFIPMAFGAFLFVFQIRYSSYLGYFGLQILSLHLIIDIICLLYFVKPYKTFVKNIFIKGKVINIKPAFTTFVEKRDDSL